MQRQRQLTFLKIWNFVTRYTFASDKNTSVSALYTPFAASSALGAIKLQMNEARCSKNTSSYKRNRATQLLALDLPVFALINALSRN